MAKKPESLPPWEALLALRTEMHEGYLELAEQLQHCNNEDASETFGLLAALQQNLLKQLQAKSPPRGLHPGLDTDQETPASVLYSGVHYLMNAHQVVELAIAAEQQLQRCITISDPLQTALQRSLSALLATLPPPTPHWDEDLDPPNLDD